MTRRTEGTVRRDRATAPILELRASVVGARGESAEGDVLSVGSAPRNDLVLDDPTVSGFHLELARRPEGVRVRDLASTNGTRVGPVHFCGSEIFVPAGTTLELGSSKVLVSDGSKYTIPGRGPERFGGLVGASADMRAVTATLARVAPSDVSVLLSGESGTGKELAARAIHDHSPRKDRPFVTVDCGAIAPTLFASELFGHERGAFTGADRRHAGAFERAHGGTLFLDEIGELGPELQASLLGVLERRRFRRVGGTSDLEVDVRIVAATHRNVRAMVNAGAFRLDLYYRIATVRVVLPALRDRPEDIPALVQSLLRDHAQQARMADLFDEATMDVLARHDWPGNVRELRNVVLGALALDMAPTLERDEPSAEPGDPIARALDLDYAQAKRAVLDEFEKRWLARVLARTQGNVRAASREGRIERKHLIELLERHGLKP